MTTLSGSTLEADVGHELRGWRGVRLMAGLEFSTRLRGRWRIVLALWAGVALVVTFLLWLAVRTPQSYEGPTGQIVDPRPVGILIFGWLMVILLGLGLLVTPAFTATSVNGERDRGTLAVLQSTLLRPWQVAVGKLAAGAASVLVLLALALPGIAWAYVLGGIGIWQVAAVLLATAVVLVAVVAIGLAWSARMQRPIVSTLLTYLTVGLLTIGTVITFVIALFTTTDTVTRTYEQPAFDVNGAEIPGSATTQTYETSQPRPDRIWWLLAPNPFVLVADAAPAREPWLPSAESNGFGLADPLTAIVRNVQQLRSEPVVRSPDLGSDSEVIPERGPLVWPWGTGLLAVVVGWCLLVTTRRLRTPYRKLARGQRIA